MSKNYIFGPEEIEINVGNGYFQYHTDTDIDLSQVVGATVKIANTVMQAYLNQDEYYIFDDGTDNNSGGIDLDILYGGYQINGRLDEFQDFPLGSQTVVTMSIYTGEDDPEPEPSNGLPDRNITYEFKNTAQNDIEDIIQAIYVSLNTIEPQNINGYSPADRLVAAVAALHNVDVTTALTTGGYPNQMKRIAAIIRGDFDEGELTPVPIVA